MRAGLLGIVRDFTVVALAGIAGIAGIASGCGPAKDPHAATAAATDGGAAEASAPEAKPFAGSTAEATALISDVVDKKHVQIATCVRSYRARKKSEHERVSVSFGIDQDGRLLGVTAKGQEDQELQSCIQGALRNAPFPRSHSGVISVTKTYEEFVL